QIFVKGLDGRTLVVTVCLSSSADAAKQIVGRRCRIPASALRLEYSGKQVQGRRPLREIGVRKGSTMHASLRLRGGLETACACD
ncbi:unnamed protein product, partial [Phaeothamnion confervicola]